MPSLDRNRVDRMLQRKLGMTIDPDRHDHRQFILTIDGQRVARTFYSHGSQSGRTLGDDLVSKMARQLHVTPRFMVELVQCTKSRDDYLTEIGF